MYTAVRFKHAVFQDDLTDGIRYDLAGAGILYRMDMTAHIGLYIRVFKGKIRIFHGAVDQGQTEGSYYFKLYDYLR